MSVINDCIIIKGVIVVIKYISDKYKIYHISLFRNNKPLKDLSAA